MWDLFGVTLRGYITRQYRLPIVAALLLAIFSVFTFFSQTAYAATDVTWDGNGTSAVPVYQENKYSGPFGANNPVTRPEGVPSDATVAYEYNGDSGPTQIIYFQKGTDPSTATSALYITSESPTPKTLSVTPRAEGENGSSDDPTESTSCGVSGGLGFYICPVSNTIANGVDYMFKAVQDLMAVKPLTTDQDGVIYRGWVFMRNIANAAFVIAFLVIIFSQISSVGMSNYGIKKLLPRIVIAAILMNLSYWVCALAIDLSNVLGIQLENMFMSLREGLVPQGSDLNVQLNWESVVAGVLGGGTILLGGAALGVTNGAIVAFLLPVLLSAAFAILVAIIVLAARQAIITCLVILSPLAFVAFLLPNTDKYFDKWRSTMMTMLLLFPIFSFIFGGAQLAGGIIIVSATSATELIFGMAVQIIPLAITPLLLQFSGSLLGRIAGMVNNPQKGFIDRSKNWARGVTERGTIRGAKYNPLSAKYISMQEGRKKRDEMFQQRRLNVYGNSRRALKDAVQKSDLEAATKQIEATHEIHLSARIDPKDVHFDAKAFNRHLSAELAHDKSEHAKSRVQTAYSEIRAGSQEHMQNNAESRQLHHAMAQTSQDMALTSMRKRMADREQNSQIANALLENNRQIDGKSLRDYAGGILGEAGAESALADAVSTVRKEYDDNVQNQKQLIDHFNLSGTQRQSLAMGRDGEFGVTDDNGHTYNFRVGADYAREAAIEKQLGGAGNMANIEEIIEHSGSDLSKFKTTISSMVVKGRLSEKATYLGGQTIDDIAQGNIKNAADLNAAVIRTIAKGKIKPSQLATMDTDAVKHILSAIKEPTLNTSMLSAADQVTLIDQIRNLSASANQALTEPQIKSNVAQNAVPVLEAIRDIRR